MAEAVSEHLIEHSSDGGCGGVLTTEVAPIGRADQDLVVERTHHFISKVEALWNTSLPTLPIYFDLSGSSAGMYKVSGKQICIRYNPWIFAKYFEENLAGTVPHEVAHFAVDQTYRRSSVKPHGVEWRSLMDEFGANAEVTFNLDLSGIPQRKQRRHSYQCGCQQHMLSTTRHNRILRQKGIYQCIKCGQKLRYMFKNLS